MAPGPVPWPCALALRPAYAPPTKLHLSNAKCIMVVKQTPCFGWQLLLCLCKQTLFITFYMSGLGNPSMLPAGYTRQSVVHLTRHADYDGNFHTT